MRQRSLLRLLALLAILAMLATACGGSDSDSDTEGQDGDDDQSEQAQGDSDVLVVGVLEKPSGLDPAKIYEKFASDVLFNTTNRLVEFPAGETEVGPGLATEWEISEDGLTYTFTLREGVTFHDGSDFDSEDVKFSLDRAMNINHPDSASFLLSGISSIEAPDPQTVVITLTEPNVTFLSRLNYTVASILPSDSDAYTAPEAKIEDNADESNSFINDETIIGTGPYELTEYQPGTSMTLEAFEDYWGEDTPAVPTIRIQFFEDSAQLRNALAAGEVDLNINEMGPAERTSLESEDGIAITEGKGARIRYIVLDVTQAPFDDPAVRRAIAASVDRERVIEEVFEGAGTPLFSMIPSGFDWAHADHMSDISEEVEGPVTFDLWYPLNKYGDTEPDLAETIARSLNETGDFEVTTKSADWASEYSSNLNTGTYGAYLLAWYPDYFDPDDYIEPFYSSEGFVGFYKSPEMDELIKAEQQATDQDERAEIFDEIQQLAAEDMPFIPLFEETPFAYHSDAVQGVENSVDPTQQVRYWLLSK